MHPKEIGSAWYEVDTFRIEEREREKKQHDENPVAKFKVSIEPCELNQNWGILYNNMYYYSHSQCLYRLYHSVLQCVIRIKYDIGHGKWK